MKIIYPVIDLNTRINQYFSTSHKGIDLNCYKTEVYCIFPKGKVCQVWFQAIGAGQGISIVSESENGFVYIQRCYHLDHIIKGLNVSVTNKDVVAVSGNTGKHPDGTQMSWHLHWTMVKAPANDYLNESKWEFIDPLKFYQENMGNYANFPEGYKDKLQVFKTDLQVMIDQNPDKPDLLNRWYGDHGYEMIDYALDWKDQAEEKQKIITEKLDVIKELSDIVNSDGTTITGLKTERDGYMDQVGKLNSTIISNEEDHKRVTNELNTLINEKQNKLATANSTISTLTETNKRQAERIKQLEGTTTGTDFFTGLKEFLKKIFDRT